MLDPVAQFFTSMDSIDQYNKQVDEYNGAVDTRNSKLAFVGIVVAIVRDFTIIAFLGSILFGSK